MVDKLKWLHDNHSVSVRTVHNSKGVEFYRPQCSCGWWERAVTDYPTAEGEAGTHEEVMLLEHFDL